MARIRIVCRHNVSVNGGSAEIQQHLAKTLFNMFALSMSCTAEVLSKFSDGIVFSIYFYTFPERLLVSISKVLEESFLAVAQHCHQHVSHRLVLSYNMRNFLGLLSFLKQRISHHIQR